MRFCQAFTTELWRHIGADTDVPAGDIGVGGREVGYMYGQYRRLANEVTGVFTGKGWGWGGSLIRPEATGYGCVYFLQEMMNHRADSLEGKTCIVSGSGNVAQFTAEKIMDLGGKVLTLSDSGGFIHEPKGLTREKLAYVKDLKNNRRGRLTEYAKHFKCEYHEGRKPWGIKANFAFPCATQNEIESSDAKAMIKNGIRAVAEGANMPTNLEAIRMFQEARVLFGPGKAANAGGVAVSGLEMAQNSQRLMWDRDRVDEELRNIMANIHKACVEHGDDTREYVDYLRGANVAGFIRVADAMLAQGVM
jgi:glutamate dehydrogenase (NADP+)